MLVVYSLLLLFFLILFLLYWSSDISIVNEFTTFLNDLINRKFCVLNITFLKVFKTKKSGNGSSIRYDGNTTF